MGLYRRRLLVQWWYIHVIMSFIMPLEIMFSDYGRCFLLDRIGCVANLASCTVFSWIHLSHSPNQATRKLCLKCMELMLITFPNFRLFFFFSQLISYECSISCNFFSFFLSLFINTLVYLHIVSSCSSYIKWVFVLVVTDWESANAAGKSWYSGFYFVCCFFTSRRTGMYKCLRWGICGPQVDSPDKSSERKSFLNL